MPNPYGYGNTSAYHGGPGGYGQGYGSGGYGSQGGGQGYAAYPSYGYWSPAQQGQFGPQHAGGYSAHGGGAESLGYGTPGYGQGAQGSGGYGSGGYGSPAGGYGGQGYQPQQQGYGPQAYQGQQFGQGQFGRPGPQQGSAGGPRSAGAMPAKREDRRRKGPRNYQRSDERLRDEVYDRLIQQTDIDVSEIECTITGGVVSLEGTVESRWERHQIEDLVDTVWGTRDIRNNLRIRSGQVEGRAERGTRGGESPQAGAEQARRDGGGRRADERGGS
ncbi:MAG: BON domain-containing protein [Phycisphaerales bacterium]